MRKVTVRALENPAKSVLLALNRFFYVLKPVAGQSASLSAAGQEPTTVGYKVLSQIEAEATQHFEVFEE